MARNIVTNATVNVSVNDVDATRRLEELRKRSQKLRDEITRLANGGAGRGNAQLRAMKKELQDVDRQIAQCERELSQVDSVMRRLDSATPKQLRKTLSSLRADLNNIKRGTAAWESHVAKIRLVEAELARVNSQLAVQEGRWARMNAWLNNTQTAIMGVAAALAGLIMAGRKAVGNYADMEESMMNTVKYTRMTEGEVKKLNDAFLKIDTRLYRDELNALAQEGGRLGKNTLKDVMEYTEAAQIIKVALVDLGEGATQTIAKIGNIFGVEQALGTKKAMLSIGSAVNVLSQNCTASKPYLVNFAQRMAGIGAQAGLTVPQILAFGAVLDANGQKVEMSATALQKVLMALANKNREFSKVLGLDAEKLSNTLRKSAKGGLMMYLEAIKRLSDRTSADNATVALAPLFKDMGMDAARVATVLSTLANHIDELKWQFGEADKAFREATSASQEFALFNNTVQAQMEKAKGRVRELSIELGEKLYPVMRHIYTSSSVFLRVLSRIVTFFIEHRRAIVTLTLAVAAYVVTVKAAAVGAKLWAGACVMVKGAVGFLQAAVFALTATVHHSTVNIGKARAAWRAFSAALSANPIGLLVAALTAAGVAIYNLVTRTNEFRKSMDEAMSKATSYAEAIDRERKELDRLFGALDGAKKGTKEYDDARKELLSRYGVYLRGLVDECGEIKNLTLAYERLGFAARKAAQARSLSVAQEKLDQTYFEKVDELTEKLREALESSGMGERDVTRIITKLSQRFATGQGVNKDIYDEVSGYQHRNESLWRTVTMSTPLHILNDLQEAQEEYRKRKDKLDSMDTRVLKENRSDELDRLIAEISEQLGNLVTDKIEVDMSFSDEKLLDRLNELISDNVTGKDRNSADKYWSTGKREDRTFESIEDEWNAILTGVHRKQEGAGVSAPPSGFVAPPVEMVWRDRTLAEPERGRALANSGPGLSPYHSPAPLLNAGNRASGVLARDVAENLLRELMFEREKRGGDLTATGTSVPKEEPEGGFRDYHHYSDSDHKEWENRQKAAKIKAEKKFKEGLDRLKALYESREAEALMQYSTGAVNYQEYLELRKEADAKYFYKLEEHYQKHFKSLGEGYYKNDEDFQALMKKKQETIIKRQGEYRKYRDKIIVQQSKREEAALIAESKLKEKLTLEEETELQEKIFRVRYDALVERRDLHTGASAEWQQIQDELSSLVDEHQEEKRRLFEERIVEMRRKYAGLSGREQFRVEMATLKTLLDAKKVSLEEFERWKMALQRKYAADLPGGDFRRTAEEGRKERERKRAREVSDIDAAVSDGIISREEGERRKSALSDADVSSALSKVRECGSEWVMMLASVGDAWRELWRSIEEGSDDVLTRVGAAAQATFAAVSAGMKVASEFAQVNAQIEIAAVEKRYKRESELAVGNSYLQARLEREKSEKVADIKNRASRASFGMQVIQATAQMIQGAINAYTSTAAIPVVGPALAPAAAAVAAAAGAAQIVLLKKLQEAAESTGYSAGGYTGPGRRDDVAGVVHAGEWVAPQWMLRDPVAASVVERLEVARVSGDVRALDVFRERVVEANVSGSLSAEDASRVVAAGARTAVAAERAGGAGGWRSQSPESPEGAVPAGSLGGVELVALAEALGRLNKRLDEPFVTVLPMSGDSGFEGALNRLERLKRNMKR